MDLVPVCVSDMDHIPLRFFSCAECNMYVVIATAPTEFNSRFHIGCPAHALPVISKIMVQADSPEGLELCHSSRDRSGSPRLFQYGRHPFLPFQSTPMRVFNSARMHWYSFDLRAKTRRCSTLSLLIRHRARSTIRPSL